MAAPIAIEDWEQELARLKSIQIERVLAEEDSQLANRVIDFTAPIEPGSVLQAVGYLEMLARRSLDPIAIRITSPGGGVMDGLRFYDELLDLRARGIHVTTIAEGYAASMAGVILQGGDLRIVGPHAHLLLHEVHGSGQGSTSERAEQVALQKRLQDTVLDILSERATGMTRRQIAHKWLKTDWWVTADQAVSYGLADRVGGLGVSGVNACATATLHASATLS